MHICISKLSIIGSDNSLSPDRCQTIIRTDAGILSIGPIGTIFIEILFEIHKFSFKKIHFKMLSGKWRPFCFSLNVIKIKQHNKQFTPTNDSLCLVYQVYMDLQCSLNLTHTSISTLLIKQEADGAVNEYCMSISIEYTHDLCIKWCTTILGYINYKSITAVKVIK